MNDHSGQSTGPGSHSGNGRPLPLVRESRENLTFSVNREVFVSREIFEREQRAVFDRCWIYVGHTSEVPNPGDYKTRSVAGRPVIFCRDRNGQAARPAPGRGSIRIGGGRGPCARRGAVAGLRGRQVGAGAAPGRHKLRAAGNRKIARAQVRRCACAAALCRKKIHA